MTLLETQDRSWCTIHQHFAACEHNTDVDPAELAHYEGSLGWRNLDDGRVIVLYPMLYNFRICVGPQMDLGFDRGWCYPKSKLAAAVASLLAWDGDGDPVDGWIKEVGTHRRRRDGDPSQEYDDREESE